MTWERPWVDPSVRTAQIGADVELTEAGRAGYRSARPMTGQLGLDRGGDLAVPVHPFLLDWQAADGELA